MSNCVPMHLLQTDDLANVCKDSSLPPTPMIVVLGELTSKAFNFVVIQFNFLVNFAPRDP